jgi:hypothetical protein
MRPLTLSIAALSSFILFADAALAKRVTIGGTHSAGEIKAKCAAQGGAFASESWGGYACVNTDKGTAVNCDAKGKCFGTVPRQLGSGGPTGTIKGGTANAGSLPATRTGGTQPTHGPLPTSAATIRKCSNHHC